MLALCGKGSLLLLLALLLVAAPSPARCAAAGRAVRAMYLRSCSKFARELRGWAPVAAEHLLAPVQVPPYRTRPTGPYRSPGPTFPHG